MDQALIPPGQVCERVFEALCSMPYGVRMSALIERVYPDPDDEPGYPEKNLHARICQMNKWWALRGALLRIRGHGGPGSVYRIWIARRK